MKLKKLLEERNILIRQVDLDKPVDIDVLENQLNLEGRLNEQICEETLQNQEAKRIVLEIRPSVELPQYNEARFYVIQEDGSEPPTERMPGFFVADIAKDLMLARILERSTDYITQKIDELGDFHLVGDIYEFGNITIANVAKTEDGTFADLEIEIHQYEEIPLMTLQPLWSQHILPKLKSESRSLGQKAKILLELQRKIVNNLPSEKIKEISENISSLCMVLSCACKLPEIYGIAEERSGYNANQITLKDSKLKHAMRFNVQNLHEAVFCNPDHIEGLAFHEISGKFAAGKPYKVQLEKQRIVYE